MDSNSRLDEQTADFRNIKTEPTPLPEVPQAVATGNKQSLPLKVIIIVSAIAIVFMAIVYYVIFYRLSSPAPVPRLTCPNGQPMPKNPPCPPATK